MKKSMSSILAALIMLAMMIFGGYVLTLWVLHSMIAGLMINAVTRIVALLISVTGNVALVYKAARK